MLSLVECQLGTNPFVEYPQLKHIWEPELQEEAERATTEDLTEGALDNTGPIYTIRKDDQVIGITGLYLAHMYVQCQEGEQTLYVGLRWHGIVPVHRGRGFGAEALTLICEKAVPWYVKIVWDSIMAQERVSLVEMMPTNRRDQISPFFQSQGFTVLDREIINMNGFGWELWHKQLGIKDETVS